MARLDWRSRLVRHVNESCGSNYLGKLVEGLSTQEIIDHLVKEFEAAEGRVSSDVGRFIEVLKEHLLISDDPEWAD